MRRGAEGWWRGGVGALGPPRPPAKMPTPSRLRASASHLAHQPPTYHHGARHGHMEPGRAGFVSLGSGLGRLRFDRASRRSAGAVALGRPSKDGVRNGSDRARSE